VSPFAAAFSVLQLGCSPLTNSHSAHTPLPFPRSPSLFILLRYWPKLGCENFRTLARDAVGAIILDSAGRASVKHPDDGEVAALRKFNLARRGISFLRSVAILLQMYGAALPAWWLVGVSTLELALMAAAWRALAEWTRAPGSHARWDHRSTLLLVLAFGLTHGAGVGCLARPGGCGDLAGLGAVLIALNVALLGWLAARPCARALAALRAPDADTAAPETPTFAHSFRSGKRYVNYCCKLADEDKNAA
jgi:hypothetical protein